MSKFEPQQKKLQEAILKAIEEFRASINLDDTELPEEGLHRFETYVLRLSDAHYQEALQLNRDAIAGIQTAGARQAEELAQRVAKAAESEARLRAESRFVLKIRPNE